MNLLVSTPEKEGLYEAAKWLKTPVLASEDEIRSLFALFGPSVNLVRVGAIGARSELSLHPEALAAAVGRWNLQLRSGLAPSQADLRSVLACTLSKESEAFWLQELPDGRFLAKVRRPSIQIQAHCFAFSREEKQFHSMVFGKECIFWGIQFSYPQIFIDPQSGEPKKVDASFTNSSLFQQIRLWARNETRATPFLFEGEKICAPIRLGKQCFSWIANHPQLIAHGLGVADAR